MRIYVASSWREPRQPVVVDALRVAGHEVYDFRNPAEGNHGFHWSEIDPNWEQWGPDQFVEGLRHPLADQGFGFDLRAMQWADACVHVVPETAGRSSHLELGWCAGTGKLTIILVNASEPELMYKLADHIVTSIDDVLAPLELGRPA